MQKGVIFLPPRFYKRFTDHRRSLFQLISEEFGFPFYVRNFFGTLPADLKVILLYSNPHTKDELMDLENIPNRTKVIWFCEDLHARGVLQNFSKGFVRADKIIGPNMIAFRQRFPQFIDKFISFKKYFATDKRYTSLAYNTNPKMRCLLTGASSASYPLRAYFKSELAKDGALRELVDVNWHLSPKRSGETAPVYGDAYAKRLNSYFCGITCSTKNHYAIGKYVEIPAAGSLLLADQMGGSDEMGLIPGKHFVPITKETISNQIKAIFKNPLQYEIIRKQGMEYVRTNHSIKNRFEQLKEIIQQELDNG